MNGVYTIVYLSKGEVIARQVKVLVIDLAIAQKLTHNDRQHFA